MWNELTFLWNELTILWNDLTIDWNDLTWNDLTMERNDRKSLKDSDLKDNDLSETQITHTRGGKQSLALIDINTVEKDNNGSKRLSSTPSVSNRKHLLWVFFVYRATLSEKKFHLRPRPCPL